MVVDIMISAGMDAFKQKLEEFGRFHCGQALSAEVAHSVTLGINEAVAAAGKAAFRAFVESKDVHCPEVSENGETYRFKCFSEKTFMTFWGPETFRRSL